MRGRETAASRAKAATLTTLKRDMGKEKIGHLDRQKLIDYGKMRADQGAGPVTLGIDIGVIKMIITHAAAVHGLDISPEPVDLARVALKRLGLIGNLVERCFNKLKNARRVATRYDKTAETFLGFIDITSIRLWVRLLST